MHQPFRPTAWQLFRHRKRLRIGPDSRIHPSVVLSVGRLSHIHAGKNCGIGQGVILATYGGFIEMGDNVNINPYTIFYGQGGLTIGDKVSIAAHCTFVPANHVFTRTDIPIRDQGLVRLGIAIGSDVWISANCTILDGASIGDGCVIAAGSVVRGSTDPYCVYGGVPARKLKARALEVAGAAGAT